MQQFTRNAVLFLGGSSLIFAALLAVACGSDDNGSTPLPSADNNNGQSSGNPSNNNDETDPEKPKEDGSPPAPDCSKAAYLRNPIKATETSKAKFFCQFFESDAGSYCAIDETCCNPAKVNPGDLKYPPTFCATGDKGVGDQGNVNLCKTYAEEAAADPENKLKWPENATSPGTQWECASSLDCKKGKDEVDGEGDDKGEDKVCCMYTSTAAAEGKTVNIGKHLGLPAACNAEQAFNEGGSRCATACSSSPKQEIQLCAKDTNECGPGKTCSPFRAFYSRDLGYCK